MKHEKNDRLDFQKSIVLHVPWKEIQLPTLIPTVKLNATVKSLNYTGIVSNLFQRDQSRVKLYFVIRNSSPHSHSHPFSLSLSLIFSKICRYGGADHPQSTLRTMMEIIEGGRESCIHSRCSISWFRKIDKAFRQFDSLAWSVPKRPFVSVRMNLMRAETQTCPQKWGE